MEHVHLLGSLGSSVGIAWPTSEGRPVLGRQGGKFKEKTFPRLVQTGEGSSVNSTGTKFMEKTPPLAASDGGNCFTAPRSHRLLPGCVAIFHYVKG